MAEYQSAEEAKAKSIAVMGEDLGAQYHALWQEVASVHAKWGQYVDLYGTKPSRIELLNRAAPRFFRQVQDAFWQDILLSIARITDSPTMMKKSNLTIRALPPLVSDATLQKDLAELVEKAFEAAGFCRDAKNRRFSHRDLELALGSNSAPLLPASRVLVNEALKTLSDALNCLSRHFFDSETFFGLHDPSGGALSLLYILDDGLRRAEERRLKTGKQDFTSEDFIPRDL